MRPLEELSYAELMELFPIALVPHRDAWREQYARERERLLAQLPEDAVFRLSHVGTHGLFHQAPLAFVHGSQLLFPFSAY